MTSVVVFAFDGLQPVQVTPERMPNLSAFAAEGVAFDNHHSQFPTVTRPNVVSMLTGRYPGGHGVAANMLVVRDFDPRRAIPADRDVLADVKQRTGRLLLAPHLAEILGAAGEHYVAVGIGTGGNAYLQNPSTESSGGATIHPEFCLPKELHTELTSRYGQWPPKERPDESRLAHAIEIMTEYVLVEQSPAVAMLWCCEPDSSQHAAGVGSDLGERALSAADRQFGKLIGWLEETGRDAETDVIVISDHGQTTAAATFDIEELVRDAGFFATDVVVASNGGSVLFYVREQDPSIADRLGTWLIGQQWCGPVVASKTTGGISGTVAASAVGVEGERAPDLAMSFAWDSKPNGRGYDGHSFNSLAAPGLGIHGSMSSHEMRCVMMARGPSFKRGLAIDTPTGNVDLAPTILKVLGLHRGDSMDGRVLEEALADGPHPDSIPRTTEVHTAERTTARGMYRQQISVSRVGSTHYVDQGQSAFDEPQHAPLTPRG